MVSTTESLAARSHHFFSVANHMVHIPLLPPALSWRVTSVGSPRLAAKSLPSNVCSLPTSYTPMLMDEREQAPETWRGLPGIQTSPVCLLPNTSFSCLPAEEHNPPLVFPGRVELIELIRKPPLRAIWLAYKITANEGDSQLAI